MGLFFFFFLLIVALDGYRIRRPVGSCSVPYLVPYFQVTSPVLVSPCEIYVAYRVSWESTFHLSRVMCVWFSLLSWSGGGLVSKSCPTLWTPWTAARQASLSFTISWTLLNLMSIESVMLSNHLILCRPLLLLPSIFPSIRVFSSESALRIKWPKYWGFGFSVSPSSEVNDACVYISIYVCSYTPVQARRH